MEYVWNEVPLQPEMKLAYVAFKSLVVGEGNRGTRERSVHRRVWVWA